MGDTRDRAMALATLVEAFGVKGEDMKPVRIRAYEDALKDIPIPLLNAAIRKAIATRQWFPKVAELREDAEACRRELVAAHPFVACDSCGGTGWEPMTVENVSRYQRCVCWRAHVFKLNELGVTREICAPTRRQLTTAGDE